MVVVGHLPDPQLLDSERGGRELPEVGLTREREHSKSVRPVVRVETVGTNMLTGVMDLRECLGLRVGKAVFQGL